MDMEQPMGVQAPPASSRGISFGMSYVMFTTQIDQDKLDRLNDGPFSHREVGLLWAPRGANHAFETGFTRDSMMASRAAVMLSL